MTSSPIKDIASNVASKDATLFFRANEEPFRQLVTFLDFAPEKFTICFVSVNFADDRAAIIEALKQHPDCKERQFVQFEFNDAKLEFLQDELIERLSKMEQPLNKKAALLLIGLEASIGMVGDYLPMLVDLNYVRDGFVTNVPYPIVIFLLDKALSRLAEFAPDFWAWRMAVIRFERVPEAVKARVDQVRQGVVNGQLLPKETANKDFDTLTKRDILPRLLMEYESGSLAQDQDYRAFKSELEADLGICLYDNDDLEVAKDLLQKSLETETFEKSSITRPKAHYYLGIIEGRQKHYPEALELLNLSITEFEALEDNHSDGFTEGLAKAIGNRGATYRLQERYDEALADFTQAIALDPEYDWAIAGRGFVYLLLGDYEQSLQNFDQSLQMDAHSDWHLYLRALTYTALTQTEPAKADIEAAIKLAQQSYETNPQDCQNIFNLAIYHLIANNPEQATILCQDALAKEPPLRLIKAAIRDIKDLLTVLPSYPHAEELRSYLSSALALRTSALGD